MTVAATLTRNGSLRYTCPRCGGEHWHGAGDATVGTVEHRQSHCPDEPGDVALIIVAAEQTGAAA